MTGYTQQQTRCSGAFVDSPACLQSGDTQMPSRDCALSSILCKGLHAQPVAGLCAFPSINVHSRTQMTVTVHGSTVHSQMDSLSFLAGCGGACPRVVAELCAFPSSIVHGHTQSMTVLCGSFVCNFQQHCARPHHTELCTATPNCHPIVGELCAFPSCTVLYECARSCTRVVADSVHFPAACAPTVGVLCALPSYCAL